MKAMKPTHKSGEPIVSNCTIYLSRVSQITETVRREAPLLVQEGWREAPGWSLTYNRPRLTTPSAPFKGCFATFFFRSRPPLLFQEGSRVSLTRIFRFCVSRRCRQKTRTNLVSASEHADSHHRHHHRDSECRGK